MKSKRAKEHISRHQRYLKGDEVNLYIHISRATNAVELAEQDAEERAMQAFEEAKERIKAAVRLTFNGCLDSQLLERRLLIFNDLLNEINNGGQSDE